MKYCKHGYFLCVNDRTMPLLRHMCGLYSFHTRQILVTVNNIWWALLINFPKLVGAQKCRWKFSGGRMNVTWWAQCVVLGQIQITFIILCLSKNKTQKHENFNKTTMKCRIKAFPIDHSYNWRIYLWEGISITTPTLAAIWINCDSSELSKTALVNSICFVSNC